MTISQVDPFILLLVFGSGIIVASLRAIRQWKDLLWWAAGWLVAVIIVSDKASSKEQFLLMVFLVFSFGVTAFLYKNILPKIREQTLLFLTLLFLYCLVKYILLTPLSFYLLLLISPPFLLVIYFSFVNVKLSSRFKLFFYILFILLNMFFILFYLFSKEMSLLDYSKLDFASPINAFLIGVTVFSLMANFALFICLFFQEASMILWQKEREYGKSMQIFSYQGMTIRNCIFIIPFSFY